VEPYLISSALRGIISQRLVRRICPKCREAYDPTEKEMEDLGLPRASGLKFYRGAGCPNCFHTGYRGRVAVFEMLEVNSHVRGLISRRARREQIEEELKGPESGFVSLRKNAVRLVLEGVTTGEEVLRVISEED
jgi:type IV pilus assembly protein PilB